VPWLLRTSRQPQEMRVQSKLATGGVVAGLRYSTHLSGVQAFHQPTIQVVSVCSRRSPGPSQQNDIQFQQSIVRPVEAFFSPFLSLSPASQVHFLGQTGMEGMADVDQSPRITRHVKMGPSNDDAQHSTKEPNILPGSFNVLTHALRK
jgi:hypothetical protein